MVVMGQGKRRLGKGERVFSHEKMLVDCRVQKTLDDKYSCLCDVCIDTKTCVYEYHNDPELGGCSGFAYKDDWRFKK
jgi:hypothetical protein